MGGKVCLRCRGKTLLGVVIKLLKTKSLLTSPSNVLPYYLQQTFLQKFEFSLKVRRMRSNLTYIFSTLQFFLDKTPIQIHFGSPGFWWSMFLVSLPAYLTNFQISKYEYLLSFTFSSSKPVWNWEKGGLIGQCFLRFIFLTNLKTSKIRNFAKLANHRKRYQERKSS